MTDHHRQLLQTLLRQVEALDRDIAELEGRIRKVLEPHQDVVVCSAASSSLRLDRIRLQA